MTQRKRNDLSPVLWEGRQWAVTTYGLETISEPYHYYLTPLSLNDKRTTPRGEVFDNPLHMVEKEWLDVEDYLTAWLAALALHGQQSDQETVRLTITEAHKLRRELCNWAQGDHA